jgi:hypothetical protein
MYVMFEVIHSVHGVPHLAKMPSGEFVMATVSATALIRT